MTPDSCKFSLTTRTGIDPQPVPAVAHASGRLDGVMFDLTRDWSTLPRRSTASRPISHHEAASRRLFKGPASEHFSASFSPEEDNEPPAFESTAHSHRLDPMQHDPLRALKDRFVQQLSGGDPWSVSGLHPTIRQAIDEPLAIGLSAKQTWLLLACWRQIRAGKASDPGGDSAVSSMAQQIDPHLLRSGDAEGATSITVGRWPGVDARQGSGCPSYHRPVA